MAELLLSLVPLLIGVVLSPLAIMALVAILLSAHSRQNGVAFTIGWGIAVLFVLAIAFLLLALLGVEHRASPAPWVAVVRLILGVVLLVVAVFIVLRGRGRAVAMAHAATPTDVVRAAPQLPGWLRSIEQFTPQRSLALGFGIFVLNPVDASCAAIAALDIRLADVSTTQGVVVALVFAVLAVVPIALPTILAAVKGRAAEPFLSRLRLWISTHSMILNAALVAFIGLLQIQKAIAAFLAM